MSGPFNKNINNMKKNLTLDFNVKKNNLTIPIGNSILNTPDLVDVRTPDLENIILTTEMPPNTPTPSLLFPRAVTEEQETFAVGFVEALNSLHNSNSQQESDSNASTIYNNESSNFMPAIKEEPQTVPNIGNSPPVSPVDMEYQEKIKLERKRQRNRLAASKCRSRKLERISKLEDKVKQLKTENTELSSVVNQLKEHVGLLKLEFLEHANAGCPIVANQYN